MLTFAVIYLYFKIVYEGNAIIDVENRKHENFLRDHGNIFFIGGVFASQQIIYELTKILLLKWVSKKWFPLMAQLNVLGFHFTYFVK